MWSLVWLYQYLGRGAEGKNGGIRNDIFLKVTKKLTYELPPHGWGWEWVACGFHHCDFLLMESQPQRTVRSPTLRVANTFSSYSSHLEGELESLRFGLETSKVVVIWVSSLKDSNMSASKEWSFGLLLVSRLALLFCFFFFFYWLSKAGMPVCWAAVRGRQRF